MRIIHILIERLYFNIAFTILENIPFSRHEGEIHVVSCHYKHLIYGVFDRDIKRDGDPTFVP